MAEATRMPEIFPTIITDIEEDQYAKSVDVDLDILNDYLQGQGLTPSDIADLSIWLDTGVDQVFSIDTEAKRVKFVAGNYSESAKSIHINLAATAIADYVTENHHDDPARFGKILELHVAAILGHELEHYIASIERDFAEVDSRPIMPLTNGYWDDQAHRGYRKHPEEIRARQAEDRYPAGGIHISMS